MSDAASPRPAPTPPSPPRRTAPVVLFALLAAAISSAGVLTYESGVAVHRLHGERELEAIAALEVDEIARWREERLADGDALATGLEVAQSHLGRTSGDAAMLSTARGWFRGMEARGDYTAFALVGPRGEVREAEGPSAGEIADAGMLAAAREAIATDATALSEVHRGAGGGALHLDLAAPVRDDARRARAAVVLRIDPYRSLFRVLRSWPAPSRTAEALLVRREGDRVRLLSDPRHGVDPARVAVPLERSTDPAARAVSGEQGVLAGRDYRGVEVLAAARAVPASPWTLLVKIDATEALAPARERGRLIAITAAALIALVAALAALWWRKLAARFERERVRSDAARLALERKLQYLAKYANDMVILADAESRIVEVNDRVVDLLGYSRDELVGMPVHALRDPATIADFDARVRTQIDQEAVVFETRYCRKDGTTFPVEVSVRVTHEDGRRWFQAVTRDITDRKRAEEALRESEAKFRAAFQEATLGIALVAPDGTMLDSNRALQRILGYTAEELRGLPVRDLNEPEARLQVEQSFRMLREGLRDVIEYARRLRRKDGTFADVVLRASAIRDASGAFRYGITVLEDVSEKKRMETQLLLADRMASVGTLAAGVAHEINNPLAFILANLEFALETLARGGTGAEELARALHDAREGGARVREIVRDLKAFSRADGNDREPTDAAAVLQSSISLASNELRHRARVEVRIAEVPPVLASRHRLGQVFLNLLINAAQAIPEGNADANRVRASVARAPDGRVAVEISDTGVGIDPEIRSRIFDPFFTTKPVGVGTGLGLSICHGIVSGLGGEIEVESAPGRGSTFRVLLPRAPSGVRVPELPAPTPPPRRSGRVLVVDDEPLVGRAVARILSPPHEVVVQTSPRAALERLAAGEGFDVVLCDLMMPEMTGMELHARLSAQAPALADRVVFLTGGAFTPAAREFLDRVPNVRVEKPFEPVALRAVVSALLEAPRAA